MALVRISQRLQSPGWTQILNATFRRRTGRLNHRICLRLRTSVSWSIMATAVYANPELQSLQALKHFLRKAWKSISLSTFQNLIGSMPNRLKAVTNKKLSYRRETARQLPTSRGRNPPVHYPPPLATPMRTVESETRNKRKPSVPSAKSTLS